MDDQQHQGVTESDASQSAAAQTDANTGAGEFNETNQNPAEVQTEQTEPTEHQEDTSQRQLAPSKVKTCGAKLSAEYADKFYKAREAAGLSPAKWMEKLIDDHLNPPAPEVQIKEVPASLSENQFILELDPKEMHFMQQIRNNRLAMARKKNDPKILEAIEAETLGSIIKQMALKDDRIENRDNQFYTGITQISK